MAVVRRSSPMLVSSIALFVFGCGRCTNDLDQALTNPESSESELVRITRGDRVLTVLGTTSRAYESAVTAGGRLPGVQEAGVRRRLHVEIRGGVGERPPGPIAEWVDEVVMESTSSEQELEAMSLTGVTVEVCEDEPPSERVAFRVRSSDGTPPRGMDDRFRGAYFLEHFVVPMRSSVAAEDCEGALAGMPPDADAWIAAELSGVDEEHRVVRTGIVRAGGRVQHTELPRSASLTAIAAALESRAVVPLLAWALADPPALTPQVAIFLRDHEHDPAHARAILDALDPANELAVDDPDIARQLVDGADLETLSAEVPRVAHEVATTCAQPGSESRCTAARLIAIAHAAARARSRAACDELGRLAAAMGSEGVAPHSAGALEALQRGLRGCDGVADEDRTTGQ